MEKTFSTSCNSPNHLKWRLWRHRAPRDAQRPITGKPHKERVIEVPRHRCFIFSAFSNIHASLSQQRHRFVPEVAPFCTGSGAVLNRKWQKSASSMQFYVAFSSSLSSSYARVAAKALVLRALDAWGRSSKSGWSTVVHQSHRLLSFLFGWWSDDDDVECGALKKTH